MKSTRLSTRRWLLAKAHFRRQVAAWVDDYGTYPTRGERKFLWRVAYRLASGDASGRKLEVGVVAQGLPAAAPDEPQRLAEGTENL